jgi:hypothetical protein
MPVNHLTQKLRIFESWYDCLSKNVKFYRERWETRMEDKITIIEGPPPTFESVTDEWVLGLSESPILSEIVVTRLRTFNGPELVERCHRAWRHQQPICLEYRTQDGLQEQAPIVAARYIETEEGHLLILWIRLANDGIELQFGYDDDLGDSEEGDSDSQDW